MSFWFCFYLHLFFFIVMFFSSLVCWCCCCWFDCCKLFLYFFFISKLIFHYHKLKLYVLFSVISHLVLFYFILFFFLYFRMITKLKYTFCFSLSSVRKNLLRQRHKYGMMKVSVIFVKLVFGLFRLVSHWVSNSIDFFLCCCCCFGCYVQFTLYFFISFQMMTTY